MVASAASSRFVVFSAVALVWLVPMTARGDDQVKALVEKLNNRINLETGFDANTPLKDALDFMSDRFDVTFVIDLKSFKEEGIDDIESFKVRLPKMKGVRMGTVLRLLLGQLDASYLVRKDYIEVTPTARLEREIWAGCKGPRLPLIHAVFEKRPLDEALKELSAATGVTVVVDERPEGKSRNPVTANLLNVPLDHAVRVLADLADLKAVQLDSVLYVTSKENAETLQAEQEKRMLRGVHMRKDAKGAVEKPEATKVPAKQPK
jgi:hypothetical protein